MQTQLTCALWRTCYSYNCVHLQLWWVMINAWNGFSIIFFILINLYNISLTLINQFTLKKKLEKIYITHIQCSQVSHRHIFQSEIQYSRQCSKCCFARVTAFTNTINCTASIQFSFKPNTTGSYFKLIYAPQFWRVLKIHI